MAAFIDITGQIYGRLTVVERAKNKRLKVCWRCRCECGSVALVTTSELRSNGQQSCGCLRDESIVARSLKHGCSRRSGRTREYRIWKNMKQRCLNPSLPDFSYYGARGISICERWRNSFENFLADMGPAPPKYTLDRIDNDGHYEPANCRWATRYQQTHNRRRPLKK